jgi:hypothetical protein
MVINDLLYIAATCMRAGGSLQSPPLPQGLPFGKPKTEAKAALQAAQSVQEKRKAWAKAKRHVAEAASARESGLRKFEKVLEREVVAEVKS